MRLKCRFGEHIPSTQIMQIRSSSCQFFFYLGEDDSDTAGSVSDARRTSIVEKDLDLEVSLARNSGNSSR